MVNTAKLRVAIKQKNMTDDMVATAIGISSTVFKKKMTRGSFGSREIESMQQLLKLKNPSEIFFANFVT